MRKKVIPFLLAVGFTALILNTVPAKDEKMALAKAAPVVVNGVIVEIAEDGSYIVVDDGDHTTKFVTSKEFVEEAYFELDDKVKVSGEKDSRGIKLVDFEYDFDYDFGGASSEDSASAVESPAVDISPENKNSSDAQ